MEDFSFVYSLLDKGIIFYIGCTKDLGKRYNIHINSSKKSTTKTAKRIKEILEDNRFPDMMIMNRLPTKDAIKLEMILINSFYSGGQLLTNATHLREINWKKSPISFDTLSKKQIMKLIKEREESCRRFYTFDNPYYSKWKKTLLEYR